MARPKTATRKLADFNPFNAINRGVYIADNLDFLRAINTASVDLVCIDPPFAKNDTFTGDKLRPPLRTDERDNEFRLLKEWGIATAAQADDAGVAWPDDPKAKGGYEDTWSWDDDVHPDWVTGIKATHEAVNLLIEATRQIHGDSIAAYLAFMAIRLFEIHRILKPTGSLYLHCDHTANGYLRQLLDGVFGNGEGNNPGFRNEVIWSHQGSWIQPEDHFPRRHDTIFWYTKSKQYTFHPGYESDAELQMNYKRWKRFLTADNQILGANMPSHDKRFAPYMNAFVKKHGREPGKTDVVLEITGSRIGDVQYVKVVDPKTPERTGYPTQKPVALAERIIKASTNPGDVVLDCFAGCAYSALAAEKLDRRWTACDINLRAWTVFKRQFNKGGNLPLLACNDRTTGQQVMGSAPEVTIHGPAQLPQRTTSREVEVKSLRTDNRRPAGSKYRGGGKETTLLNEREMKAALLRYSIDRAWCCGYRSRGTEGRPILTNYELDHITPKSKGGEDEIFNRAPLCPRHNRIKSDKDITLQELREQLIFDGELAEGMRPEMLVKLPDAYNEARRIHMAEYQRQMAGQRQMPV